MDPQQPVIWGRQPASTTKPHRRSRCLPSILCFGCEALSALGIETLSSTALSRLAGHKGPLFGLVALWPLLKLPGSLSGRVVGRFSVSGWMDGHGPELTRPEPRFIVLVLQISRSVPSLQPLF
ncbi:hypothetical protein CIB48_g186 [Xylaria polymorpha]|nr:hypothetical protein CIB48_g186 [Xylaria polymorpha]